MSAIPPKAALPLDRPRSRTFSAVLLQLGISTWPTLNYLSDVLGNIGQAKRSFLRPFVGGLGRETWQRVWRRALVCFSDTPRKYPNSDLALSAPTLTK